MLVSNSMSNSTHGASTYCLQEIHFRSKIQTGREKQVEKDIPYKAYQKTNGMAILTSGHC